jgi:hypothetical protein
MIGTAAYSVGQYVRMASFFLGRLTSYRASIKPPAYSLQHCADSAAGKMWATEANENRSLCWGSETSKISESTGAPK